MSGKPDYVRKKVVPMTAEEKLEAQRQYCASIEAIDDQVGAMVEMVKKRGMFDNTIFVFTSDHGEMLGDHGLYTKAVPYEAALRVPLIVSGPGILEDTVSEAIVELNDLNPTVCELAGLSRQDGIDSESFVPVLRGDSCAHRTEAVSRLQPFDCIRTHEYKLIVSSGGVRELYDLEDDPEELHNIIEERPDVSLDLRVRMNARLSAELV